MENDIEKLKGIYLYFDEDFDLDEFKGNVKIRLERLIKQLNIIIDNISTIDNHTVYQLSQSYYQLYNLIINKSFERLTSELKLLSEQVDRNFPSQLNVFLSSNRFENSQKSLRDEMNQIKSDFTSYKSQKEAIQNDRKEIEDLKKEYSESLVELNSNYKEVFSKVELIKQASMFDDSAKINLKNSQQWLGVIVIAIVINLILILAFLSKPFLSDINHVKSIHAFCIDCIDNVIYIDIIRSFMIRLVLIAFGFFGLKFSINNYNAEKHNFTLNSHKSNVLLSSLYLAEKTENETIRQEILNRASNNVFSHQRTGYNNKETIPNNSIITEIVSLLKK